MMLVLRPGKGLGWSIGKRYLMGGFVPVKRLIEQFDETSIGGHRSQWEVEMQAGHPLEKMAVLGLVAGQHADDDDLGH